MVYTDDLYYCTVCGTVYYLPSPAVPADYVCPRCYPDVTPERPHIAPLPTVTTMGI